jgi:hypothetical protein
MSKYNAVISYVDGIRFASKKEMYRYNELKLLVKIGEIRDLKLQVKYPLVVNDVHICDYVADFTYVDCRFEKLVVEDVKGKKIQPYPIKKKLMLACHGIEILET